MTRANLAAVLAVALIVLSNLLAGVSALRALERKAPALCGTDTECAALCPADDLQCDGGPQS